jgi:hypothetical protein
MTKKAIFGGVLAMISSLLIVYEGWTFLPQSMEFNADLDRARAIASDWAWASPSCPNLTAALSELSRTNTVLQASSIGLVLVGASAFVGGTLLFAKRYRKGAVVCLIAGIAQMALIFLIGMAFGYVFRLTLPYAGENPHNLSPLHIAAMQCATGDDVNVPGTFTHTGTLSPIQTALDAAIKFTWHLSIPFLILLTIASLTGFLSKDKLSIRGNQLNSATPVRSD